MNWRENLDPLLKDHLEMQIKKSSTYKETYSKSRDVGRAQLWVAIANLSKQVFDLNLKINVLEKTLKDSGKKDKKLLESLEKL